MSPTSTKTQDILVCRTQLFPPDKEIPPQIIQNARLRFNKTTSPTIQSAMNSYSANRSSDMQSNSSQEPLGSFAKIPTELRIMILRNCLQQGSTALPRSNSELWNLYQGEILPKTDLIFIIDPVDAQDGVDIKDGDFNLLAHVQTQYVFDQPGVSRMPLHKFRSVTFYLLRTKAGDSGQLVNLWNKVDRLLDGLLSQYERPVWREAVSEESEDIPYLPPIWIRFVGRQCDWLPGGELQYSVVTPESVLLMSGYRYDKIDDIDATSSDIYIILTAFNRLRRCRGLHIGLPGHLPAEYGSIRDICDYLRDLARERIPFGQREPYERCSTISSDNWLQQERDLWSTWLDSLLDNLPGPTAEMLRLNRKSKIQGNDENWLASMESKAMGHPLPEDPFSVEAETCSFFGGLPDEMYANSEEVALIWRSSIKRATVAELRNKVDTKDQSLWRYVTPDYV